MQQDGGGGGGAAYSMKIAVKELGVVFFLATARKGYGNEKCVKRSHSVIGARTQVL